MFVVLVIPLIGPIVYYVAGPTSIPRSVRAMLLAGGMAVYVAFAALSVVIGGS